MKKTLIIAVCMAFLLLCSCAAVSSVAIVGEWESNESVLGVDIETTYVFNDDGTGELKTVLGLTQAFTYEFEGDKLTIATETLGIKNTEVYSYTFEGDVLTLEGDNSTIELTRKK